MKTKSNVFRVLCYLIILLLVGCSTEQTNSSPSIQNQPGQPTQVFQPSATNAPVNPTSNQLIGNTIQLDSSAVNTVPPGDILQEVTFFGGGGLGVPSCPNAKLQIYGWQNDLEPGCQIYAYACGVSNNETANVSILYPNGINTNLSIKASVIDNFLSPLPTVAIHHDLTPSDPAGVYKLSIQSAEGNVEKDIVVQQPTIPTAYRYDDSIWLTNFQPNEQIRLFIYQRLSPGQTKNKLHSWISFSSDSNGKAQISFPSGTYNADDYHFVILGDRSGQVVPKDPFLCIVLPNIDQNILTGNQTFGSSTSQPANQTSCSGLSSRLAVGKSARVAYTDGNPMRIRANPGLSQSVITEVPEGARFTVVGGPQCVDNTSWWRVRTNDGSEGWMAEYSNGTYLLEPYP